MLKHREDSLCPRCGKGELGLNFHEIQPFDSRLRVTCWYWVECFGCELKCDVAETPEGALRFWRIFLHQFLERLAREEGVEG